MNYNLACRGFCIIRNITVLKWSSAINPQDGDHTLRYQGNVHQTSNKEKRFSFPPCEHMAGKYTGYWMKSSRAKYLSINNFKH